MASVTNGISGAASRTVVIRHSRRVWSAARWSTSSPSRQNRRRLWRTYQPERSLTNVSRATAARRTSWPSTPARHSVTASCSSVRIHRSKSDSCSKGTSAAPASSTRRA